MRARTARPGRMNAVPLPDLSISLDARPVECETLLGLADPRSLTVSTFVETGGHELHSSYVDAGGATVYAGHLLVAPGIAPEPRTVTLPGVDLRLPEGRRECLLDHLALVRESIATEGHAVSIDVGESALRAAAEDLHSGR